MEAIQLLIPILIQGGMTLLVIAIGLDATLEDVTYVMRRPALLLRSLLAINVLVPAFAALMIAFLPLLSVTKAGIILMAVSPFPPVIPGKELKLGGRKSYIYGLMVAVSVLAIVIVPVTVAILSEILPGSAQVAPAAVAAMIFKGVLLPLAAGMLARHLAPAFATRIQPLASRLAMLLIVLALLPILFKVWPAIWQQVGNGTVLAIIAMIFFGLIVGHFLGGPDPRDRITLAISSATRHPGIAMLIAHANATDKHVPAVILLIVLVGLIAVLPYQAWCKRRLPAAPAVSASAGSKPE